MWSRKDFHQIPEPETIAIERKLRAPLSSLSASELHYWRKAYNSFIDRLSSTTFEALVLDYDGTICDDKFRFGTLPENVAGPLNAILLAGVPIGIATGRGKSVRKALRECLSPAAWTQVAIAYHNGSEMGTLDDEQVPVENETVAEQLVAVADRIKSSPLVESMAGVDYKNKQISIFAKNPSNIGRVYRLVCDLASPDFVHGVSCVRSSHSVDVLAPGVSKQSLLHYLAKKAKLTQPRFLCIGDLGSWPGNDFSLLSMPYSLSVNEVTSIADRCWNIVPRGLRNSQATRYLLKLMTASQGTLRFNTEMLGNSVRRV